MITNECISINVNVAEPSCANVQYAGSLFLPVVGRSGNWWRLVELVEVYGEIDS